MRFEPIHIFSLTETKYSYMNVQFIYLYIFTEPKIDLSQLDIRQFEYTRQQWTGKSPKQFLIDWCRKHKVDSPKYHKMNPVRNLWKCRYDIVEVK